MKKIPLPSELCYLFGMLVVAVGTAFMEHAGFGLAPIVAPAFVLHDALLPILPWFSFGIATYVVQGILLIVLALILRRFNLYFLFSFLSGFLLGTLLDLSDLVLAHLCEGESGLWLFAHTTDARLCLLMLGILLYSMGVSLLIHSYFAPEVYELFVDEISLHSKWSFPVVKILYDWGSVIVAVLVSFIVMGKVDLHAVGSGTLLFALLDGVLIGTFSNLHNRIFRTVDLFPLRHFFHRDEALEEAKEGAEEKKEINH